MDKKNILMLGDFNMDENEAGMRSIMEDNGLVNLINSSTCFKSANGRCIDLIMTNSKIIASAAAHSRQVSVTSIIWCIPSLKLLMTDYRQKLLTFVVTEISLKLVSEKH